MDMMTASEAAKLLYTIRIAYPQAYSRATNEDLTAAAQLWARMLEERSGSRIRRHTAERPTRT